MRGLKKHKPIQSVGLAGNPEQTAKSSVVRKAAKLIAESGREVFIDQAIASGVKRQGIVLPNPAELAQVADIILVIGGDGTVLHVARETAGSNTPLLGINAGRLGFFTSASTDNVPDALDKLWSSKFAVDPLPLIEAVWDRGGSPARTLALNDILITRGANPRLVELEVAVGGDPLTTYRADGLIIATPAGSTAYSLAAGGAVVTPRAEVLTINPICPQALSNRPLIVSMGSTIEVKVLKHRAETFLSADGQMQAELQQHDQIIIRRSRQKARLVRLEGSSFFETLRHKLNWSGSHA